MPFLWGGDEGIYGIINEDRLGLDVIYLKAKRWEGSIGRPEIQKFAGVLRGKRAKKGGSSPHLILQWKLGILPRESSLTSF